MDFSEKMNMSWSQDSASMPLISILFFRDQVSDRAFSYRVFEVGEA